MAGEQTLRRKTPTFRMWNAFVIVGMISLCVAEGRMADSEETGIWVLQMFSTHSRQQCRQQCKAASSPDGHACNWSMVYQKRCLLMHCDSLHHCQKLKGRDIAGLLTGFKHFTKRKKRDSKSALYLKRRMRSDGNKPLLNVTDGAGLSATTQTTSTRKALVTQTELLPTMETTSTTAQPTTAASLATPESTTSQPTDPQLAVTTSQPATVTIKTTLPTVQPTTIIKDTTTVPSPAPSTSTFSWLPNATSATSVIGETTAIEKPLLTLNQTTESTQTNSTATQPPQSTSTQPVAIATQPALPTKDLTSAVVSVTPEKADNSTTEELNSTAATSVDQINTTALQPPPSGVVSGTPSEVPKNEMQLRTTSNPSVMSSTDRTFITMITETTIAPGITAVLQSSTTSPTLAPETTSTSTPLLATTPHKPAVTAEPAWPVTSALPTKEETTTSKTTTASLQRTHSSGPATLPSTSSASLPGDGDSQRKVSDDDYFLATGPLARHLMDKSVLLAVLLFGIVFFLAVVFVFAAQAYESYKKKDYTQVDYLINGMYADSEL